MNTIYVHKYAAQSISPAYNLFVSYPVFLSLRSVGAGISHNKHFPGGGEVTEDLVKWVLNTDLLYFYTYDTS